MIIVWAEAEADIIGKAIGKTKTENKNSGNSKFPKRKRKKEVISDTLLTNK
jgi:hypothetical protein